MNRKYGVSMGRKKPEEDMIEDIRIPTLYELENSG